MERINGIGGIFFRSENPASLRQWYTDNLGIIDPPNGVWVQAEGPTVFAPFDRDTDYFGRPEQTFMLNFRVGNLGAMLEQLRGAGIEIVGEQEDEGIGRFAWIIDPEGNRLELWEPSSPA